MHWHCCCLCQQLDSFVTAGPNTILKKQIDGEVSEAQVYQSLADDAVSSVIPKFYRQVERNDEGD